MNTSTVDKQELAVFVAMVGASLLRMVKANGIKTKNNVTLKEHQIMQIIARWLELESDVLLFQKQPFISLVRCALVLPVTLMVNLYWLCLLEMVIMLRLLFMKKTPSWVLIYIGYLLGKVVIITTNFL